MSKGPDIIGSWPEVGREPITPPEILIGCVDGLGSGIDLGHTAQSPNIALVGHPPDSASLAVQIFSSQAQLPRDARVGAALIDSFPLGIPHLFERILSIVGIPTLGLCAFECRL